MDNKRYVATVFSHCCGQREKPRCYDLEANGYCPGSGLYFAVSIDDIDTGDIHGPFQTMDGLMRYIREEEKHDGVEYRVIEHQYC